MKTKLGTDCDLPERINLAAPSLVFGVLGYTAPNDGADFHVKYEPGTNNECIQVDICEHTDTLNGRVYNTYYFTVAGIEEIVFTGGAGNDVYVNDTGISDRINGGAGNDQIVTGYGSTTYVIGGDGSDTIEVRAFSGEVYCSGDRTFVDDVTLGTQFMGTAYLDQNRDVLHNNSSAGPLVVWVAPSP